MIESPDAIAQLLPKFLLLALALNLVIGFVIFAFGRKLPRRGDWLSCVGFVLAIAALAFCIRALTIRGESFPRELLRGWIGPRTEVGALNVGILSDYLGLVVATLTALVSLVFVFNTPQISREARAERIYASLSVGATGVAVAWLSLTLWFSFIGVALVLLAAFMARAARAEDEREALSSSRFLRERAVALFFALIGALALASRGADFNFAAASSWSSGLGAQIAVATLLFGLFLGMQAFPYIASVTGPSEAYAPARTTLSQVFAAWAAFAILTRLDPELNAIGAAAPLGWVALGTAVLTVVSGLFQEDWVASKTLWISAGMSMAVAAQGFGGPAAGLPIAIGVGLGGIALSLAGAALDEGGSSSAANRTRALWAKVGAIGAAATGAGMIGFYSGGGMVRWLSRATDEPGMLVAFVTVLFLVGLQAWKAAWQVARQKNFSQASWYPIISALVLLLFGLGLFWTGTLTGGALQGSPDQVMPALTHVLFPSSMMSSGDVAMTASWIHWGAFILAALLGYWTSARKQDAWKQLQKSAPGFSEFVRSGYGAEAISRYAHVATLWSGRELDRWIDRRTWGEWLPGGLSAGVRLLASGFAEADDRTSHKLGNGLRRAIDVPAKLLQLIQSGEVQWYLFFAIGSGIAILIHFLKV